MHGASVMLALQRWRTALECYVGLDVSLKQTSICIVDQAGLVVREGVVDSDPEAISVYVRSKALNAVRIGLETGPTSTWLWTELKRLGLPVICIDARHAKAVLKMQINKSDRNDAIGIARIMQTGWFKEVHVKDVDSYSVRALLASRALLVKIKRDLENHGTHPVKAPVRSLWADSRLRSGSVSDALRAPIPRQEFVNAFGGVIRQASQGVGEPSLWIDAVELSAGDEGVDRSRTPAALVGPGEGPVSSAHGDSPQLALGGIVRYAEASVIEEAGECVPAAEAVIDCLGRIVAPGELGALFAQPRLQLDD
jgi:Transposase